MMDRIPSERPSRSLSQIEAAKRNGSLSRGPVSEDGKATARRNAIKHGLRAEEVVVQAGEDENAYRELLARLVQRFDHIDEIEAHLVRRLASIMWRTGRAERLEADLLSVCPYAARRGGRNIVIGFDTERFRVLLRYNRELESAFFRTLTALGILQDSNSPNEPERPNSNCKTII